MKTKLLEFIRKSKNPLSLEQSWNTQKVKLPDSAVPGSKGGPDPLKEAGPSKQSLEAFTKDIDIPEELSVSSLQGNPSQPQLPGVPNQQDIFREKLRRRRSADSSLSGGVTNGGF